MDAFTVAFKSMALALDSLFANVYFSLKMCHHLFQSTVSPLKNMQHLQRKKVYFRVKLNRMLVWTQNDNSNCNSSFVAVVIIILPLVQTTFYIQIKEQVKNSR